MPFPHKKSPNEPKNNICIFFLLQETHLKGTAWLQGYVLLELFNKLLLKKHYCFILDALLGLS